MARYWDPNLKSVAFRLAYLVVLFGVVGPMVALLSGFGLPLGLSLVISLTSTGALVTWGFRVFMREDQGRDYVWPYYGTFVFVIVTFWLAIELFRSFGARPLVFAALITWVGLAYATVLPRMYLGQWLRGKALAGPIYLVALPVPPLVAFELGYPLGALFFSALAGGVAVGAIGYARARGITWDSTSQAENAFFVAFFVLPVALTVLAASPLAEFLDWNVVLTAVLALVFVIPMSWVPLLVLAHRTGVWRFNVKSTPSA